MFNIGDKVVYLFQQKDLEINKIYTIRYCFIGDYNNYTLLEVISLEETNGIYPDCSFKSLMGIRNIKLIKIKKRICLQKVKE